MPEVNAGEMSASAELLANLPEVLRIFLDSDLHELTLDLDQLHLHLRRGAASDSRESAPDGDAPGPDSGGEEGRLLELGGRGRDIDEIVVRDDGHADGESDVSTAESMSGTQGSSAGGPHSSERPGVDSEIPIVSPTAGIFHRRPAPTSPPYVEVGSTVAEADTVCIIEVMKMFSEVSAECRGVVSAILVEDGSLVEEGQTLITVTTASEGGD